MKDHWIIEKTHGRKHWVDSKFCFFSELKARWLNLKVLHGLKTRAPLYRAIVPIQRCEFTTRSALFGTTSLPRVDWMFIYKTLLLMAEIQGGRWCKIGNVTANGTKPTAKSTVEKKILDSI